MISCNCGTIIRVSRQQSQAVGGTENIEQIDVESDDEELRQEFKLLRSFHIVQSVSFLSQITRCRRSCAESHVTEKKYVSM